MIGSMVPPPPPRPPRREPRPTPSFLEPTPNSIDDAMRGTDPMMGLSRADVELGNRRGGEMLLAPISTLVDEAARQGVAPKSALGRGALGAGAFVADLVNPTAWAAGAPIDRGLEVAGRVAQLAPDARQLYLNSLLGRLYHGDKTGTAPATLINRGPQAQNWFQADTFLTTSKPLARTYAWDGLYKARIPLEVAENINIMNLYNNPSRHLELANSPRVLDILGEKGLNTVLHQSGHGMGGAAKPARAVTNPFTLKSKLVPDRRKTIEAPVYAFLEPEGIKMQKIADPLGNVRGNLVNASYQIRSKLKSLLDQINKTGEFDQDNVL